jgi:hypothetical protein
MEIEIWRDIPDYEGFYMISDLGRVKSVERKDSLKRVLKQKILKQIKDIRGALQVKLYKKSQMSSQSVHRLVAVVFIKNFKQQKYIKHKDGNKENNKATNLEWCSKSCFY